MFLYYNASTGRNCASNVRTSAGGTGSAGKCIDVKAVTYAAGGR
ncbi:hypothetical protein ACIQOF_10600 [Streptomyces sp. NPDC091265]